jgi:hypothetical protein
MIKITPDIHKVFEELSHQTISFNAGRLAISVKNNGWWMLVKAIDQNGTIVALERSYDRRKEIEVEPYR